jgi:hypothetical protein
MLGSRELVAEALSFAGQEAMGNLNHDSRAIARLGVGADGAAMREVSENGQAIGNNAMAFEVIDIGEKAYATRIMLVSGIVKPVRGNKSFRQ